MGTGTGRAPETNPIHARKRRAVFEAGAPQPIAASTSACVRACMHACVHACMRACVRADPRLPSVSERKGPRLQRASRGGPASSILRLPCQPPRDWRSAASRWGASARRRSARSAAMGARGPGHIKLVDLGLRHERFSQQIFSPTPKTKTLRCCVLNLRTSCHRVHIARPFSPNTKTLSLGCVQVAIVRATAAQSASAPRGTLFFGLNDK